MNIGIVTTWCESGAAMVSRAYKEILGSRHQVYIYARWGAEYAKGDPNWDCDWVTWGKPRRRPTAVNWWDFKRWVRSRKLDLILFNEQRDYSAIVLARRELGVSLVAYVDYYTSKTVPFFNLYDALICNTKRHLSVFAAHPKATYIPWGTDCSLFHRSNVQSETTPVTFFHSFGVDPIRKGTDVALQAFKMLNGPIKFILHSQVPLSRFPFLQDLAKGDERITVIEQKVHAPGLYHMGDVYVYPTMLEGIGLTMAEASASGLPVIAPDVPPMNEFVKHGMNGRLVQPIEFRGRWDGYYWAECITRPEDVAEAMQYYVDHRDSLEKEKHAAREYAEENLDWRRNAATLPDFMDSLKDIWKNRTPIRELEEQALEATDLAPLDFLARAALRRAGLLQFEATQRILYGGIP